MSRDTVFWVAMYSLILTCGLVGFLVTKQVRETRAGRENLGAQHAIASIASVTASIGLFCLILVLLIGRDVG